MIAQHLQRVIPCVLTVVAWAAVDDDRQLRRCGQFHLAAKNFFLYVARRVIIKIVQADFAPGNQLWMFCQIRHLLIVSFRRHAGFMRMQSRAGEDPVMLLGDFQRAIVCSWARCRCRWRECVPARLRGRARASQRDQNRICGLQDERGNRCTKNASLVINITHVSQ